MNKSLILMFAILTTGCTTVIRTPLGDDSTLSPGGSNAFKNAVAENNTESVKALFKDKSFIGKESFLNDRINYMQGRAYQMLDLAIIGDSYAQVPRDVCRPEIVQTLLDANLPPRSVDLSRAAEIPCPEVVKIIISKLSPLEIESGSVEILKNFNSGVQQRHPRYYEKMENYLQVLQILKQSNTEAFSPKIVDAEELLDRKLLLPIRQAQDLKNFLEEKFKIPFCKKNNLLQSIYYPGGTVESNCIYQLKGTPLRVMQIIPQGILVSLMVDNPYNMGKVFLLKTNEQYVDDDRVGDIYVKSVGVISYTTVMGGTKTVHAFQFLGK